MYGPTSVELSASIVSFVSVGVGVADLERSTLFGSIVYFDVAVRTEVWAVVTYDGCVFEVTRSAEYLLSHIVGILVWAVDSIDLD